MSSSDVVPVPGAIYEKINSAFYNIDSSHLNGLIQFWAPVKTACGRWMLSTSDQPYALAHTDSGGLQKYRLCCMRFQYSIDDENDKLHVEEDPMVIRGAPATAFLNHLPVVQNLRVHHGSPLMCAALRCELMTSLLLPVFYPFQSSNCVGIVEYSMKSSGLFLIYNKLKSALEIQGLSTFNVEECRRFMSICSTKKATDEIQDALKIVCESHDLTLGHVWIAYDDKTHVPFPYSLAETQRKQKFAVKLIGYCVDFGDEDPLSFVKEYYDTCDVLPLKIGEGLAGKALQTFEPCFCRNIGELRDNGLLEVLPADTECSCFVICLRSIYTGDVDYAFEFLWPKGRNYFILLQSMLLTLRRFLPSFKFASGAQLGEELRVEDVENSTGSGIGFFRILEGNRISRKQRALEKRRFVADGMGCISSLEVLMNGVTVEQISNVLGVSELKEPYLVKRKQLELDREDESANSDHHTRRSPRSSDDSVKPNLNDATFNWFGCSPQKGNEEHSVGTPSHTELIIKVQYGDQLALFYSPHTTKLAEIKKIIEEKYNLDSDSYKLQFLDSEGDWLCLDDDIDWDVCVKNRRVTNRQSIRLCLLSSTNSMV